MEEDIKDLDIKDSGPRSVFDKIFGDPFRVKIVKLGPLPVPVAVPGPGWLPLGATALLIDAIRPMSGQWAPIDAFEIRVSLGLANSSEDFTISIPVPMVASRYLLSGASVGEIYIKLTIVGVIWPVVLAIDLIPPIISAIAAVIAIGATSPILIVNALASFLTELVANVFRFVLNLVMSLLCLLFGKANTVCAGCGCQNFTSQN
jgi:hypothetical protein